VIKAMAAHADVEGVQRWGRLALAALLDDDDHLTDASEHVPATLNNETGAESAASALQTSAVGSEQPLGGDGGGDSGHGGGGGRRRRRGRRGRGGGVGGEWVGGAVVAPRGPAAPVAATVPKAEWLAAASAPQTTDDVNPNPAPPPLPWRVEVLD